MLDDFNHSKELFLPSQSLPYDMHEDDQTTHFLYSLIFPRLIKHTQTRDKNGFNDEN